MLILRARVAAGWIDASELPQEEEEPEYAEGEDEGYAEDYAEADADADAEAAAEGDAAGDDERA